MFGEEESHSANHLLEIDATLLRLGDLASKVRALVDDGGEKGALLTRRDALRAKKHQGKFKRKLFLMYDVLTFVIVDILLIVFVCGLQRELCCGMHVVLIFECKLLGGNGGR